MQQQFQKKQQSATRDTAQTGHVDTECTAAECDVLQWTQPEGNCSGHGENNNTKKKKREE